MKYNSTYVLQKSVGFASLWSFGSGKLSSGSPILFKAGKSLDVLVVSRRPPVKARRQLAQTSL